jgi:hypothetical protein
MRLVQVSIPAGKRRQVLDILDAETIDYVVTEATSDEQYDAAVFFPLPTEAVEPLLESLTGVGIEEEAHSVILSAETVVSRDFKELQRSYGTTEEAGQQVAAEELRTQTSELVPNWTTYVLLSLVVANAGLLVFVNMLSINLAALGTLWYSGHRPEGWDSELRARAATKHRLALLLLAVLALSAVLVGFTANAFLTATTTQEHRASVRSVLDDERYTGVSAHRSSINRPAD